VKGKQVRALRRQGVLPAVLYGAGVEPTPLELSMLEASKILSRAGGSTLIDLSVGRKAHRVLVRDVQRDAITHALLHVDFLRVVMDVAIRTEVPVELVGEAPAVKELGGLLVTGLSHIEVEALPGDLPDRVTVDLESLTGVDDAISVGDLALGDGVKVLTESDELIARVIYQAEEVEEEEVEEEVVEVGAEPEVIERGKPEEEQAGDEEES
jgi:large subunit ribosomal protein L25